jgi:hypothetical protein
MDDAVCRPLLDDATAGLRHVPLRRPLPNPTKPHCRQSASSWILRQHSVAVLSSSAHRSATAARQSCASATPLVLGSTLKKFVMYPSGNAWSSRGSDPSGSLQNMSRVLASPGGSGGSLFRDAFDWALTTAGCDIPIEDGQTVCPRCPARPRAGRILPAPQVGQGRHQTQGIRTVNGMDGYRHLITEAPP